MDDAGVSDLTMGLRALIVSGERFRNVLARQLRLGSSDLVALGYLHLDGPHTPRDLAARMEVTSGTMTALLDRVEKAGFLTRNSNPDDRRSLLISSTPAGHHAMEWVYEHFDAALRDALTDAHVIPTDQLAAVLKNLGRAMDARAQSEPRRGAPTA